MPTTTRPHGLAAIGVVAGGQMVSYLGTSMTQFALVLWVWEITGQATQLGLLGFFGALPSLLLGPFAGTLVDRWDRKWIMLLSDLAAGLVTAGVLLLLTVDQLEIWHLYVAEGLAGICQALQLPAWSAAITVMVDEKHYARASGLISIAYAAPSIGAPLLAGGLIGWIGVSGILWLDLATFVFAFVCLLMVRIPGAVATDAGREAAGTFLEESLYGFRHIARHPGLRGLLAIFFGFNLISSIGSILLAPLILARTGDDQWMLGQVMFLFGVGSLAGGAVLSVWGGPERRLHGVLLGMAGYCLSANLLMGLGQSFAVWVVAGFLGGFLVPMVNGCSQAIWQVVVPADVQGRVFAVRRTIAQLSSPLAMLVAGPLADIAFTPAMAVDGPLAGSLGGVLGVGQGAGIGLLLVLTGALGAVAALAAWTVPAIRYAEDRMETLPSRSVMERT